MSDRKHASSKKRDLTEEQLLYKAKLAQHVGRYDQLTNIMQQLFRRGMTFGDVEIHLCEVAYTEAIRQRRIAWRGLVRQEAAEDAGIKRDAQVKLIGRYRKHIEEEVSRLCSEVFEIVPQLLNPERSRKPGSGMGGGGPSGPVSMVTSLLLVADCHRFMAELQTGEMRIDSAEKATAKYEEATSCAEVLPWTHPARLGVGLNFAVFHADIGKDPEIACCMAKEHFDAAVRLHPALDPEAGRACLSIMKLLQENIIRWTTT